MSRPKVPGPTCLVGRPTIDPVVTGDLRHSPTPTGEKGSTQTRRPLPTGDEACDTQRPTTDSHVLEESCLCYSRGTSLTSGVHSV